MRVNYGERPYKCDVCNYSLAHSGALKVHKRIHSREKPYKCHLCQYAFQTRSKIAHVTSIETCLRNLIKLLHM